jgi:hypothetical protein
MSALSRRSLIVSGSALPAIALPAAADSTQTDGLDRQATIARAEQMVATLRNCFVCDGWHESFDHKRAAQFLDAVRRQDYSAEDDPELRIITEWIGDHGQSLDWLYFGDPRGLISRAAAQSGSALVIAVPPDPIFAVIEEHRQAARRLNEICEKNEALEEQIPAERRKANSIRDRGSDVGKNDDPRWKEQNAKYWAASDRQRQLEWFFISDAPKTEAGRRALLSYTKEHEEAGYEWPNLIHHFEGERWIGAKSLDWKSCLIAKLDLLPTAIFYEDLEGEALL